MTNLSKVWIRLPSVRNIL